MANFLKPQVPLRKDENYIYPLTSVDQIVTEKGRLINEIITVDLDAEYNGKTKKIDADLLGGRPESDFLSIDLTDAEKGEFYPIYAENGIYEYSHSAGSLTGQGVNGKFKATVNETVTNLNINGEIFIVNCNGENSIELKNNCWYSFILDKEDKTINFKIGGIENGINKVQLIESLQYSGLNLTENNTPEEIFEALSKRFPSAMIMLEGLKYTGSKQIIEENNGNWRLKLLSSGELTFTQEGEVDVFLVGGGGGGGSKSGGGGGGGYTLTVRNIFVQKDTPYAITIGKGGSGGSSNNAGANGNQTTGFGYVVNGGKGGASHATKNGDWITGGSGGSGGGAGHQHAASTGVGGSDGSNGSGTNAGAGQGTTTREFGEENGTLYAGGGGGSQCTGGAGGGGNGGDGWGAGNGISGIANTGGGGGGGGYGGGDAGFTGGSGGSGIIIIRNKR